MQHKLCFQALVLRLREPAGMTPTVNSLPLPMPTMTDQASPERARSGECRRPFRSDLDLDAQLHHLVRRNTKVGGSRLVARREEHEQPLLERVHLGPRGGNQRLAAKEEGGHLWIGREAVRPAKLE